MKEQLNLAKEKMNKSLNALGNEFAAIRAGRANPGVLDKVMYYMDEPLPNPSAPPGQGRPLQALSSKTQRGDGEYCCPRHGKWGRRYRWLQVP